MELSHTPRMVLFSAHSLTVCSFVSRMTLFGFIGIFAEVLGLYAFLHITALSANNELAFCGMIDVTANFDFRSIGQA